MLQSNVFVYIATFEKKSICQLMCPGFPLSYFDGTAFVYFFLLANIFSSFSKDPSQGSNIAIYMGMVFSFHSHLLKELEIEKSLQIRENPLKWSFISYGALSVCTSMQTPRAMILDLIYFSAEIL